MNGKVNNDDCVLFTMVSSKRLIAFMAEVEGHENIPYRDSAGYWTVGIGHLLTKSELTSGKIMLSGGPVKWRNGLTDSQVDELLSIDLVNTEFVVSTLVHGLKMNRNQYEALVSFVFNVGVNAFRQSTLLKRILVGNFDDVPNQMRRWVYAGGRVVQGLENRREKEIAIWLES